MRLRLAVTVFLGASLVTAQSPWTKWSDEDPPDNNDENWPSGMLWDPSTGQPNVPLPPGHQPEQRQGPGSEGDDPKPTTTRKSKSGPPTKGVAGSEGVGGGDGGGGDGLAEAPTGKTAGSPEHTLNPDTPPSGATDGITHDREQPTPNSISISLQVVEQTAAPETQAGAGGSAAPTGSGSDTSAGGADAGKGAAPQKKNNTGLIVGVVVGVVGGLILIIGALIFVLRRRKRPDAETEAEPREGLVVDKGKARALPPGAGYETLSAQPSYYGGEYDGSSGGSLAHPQMQQMGYFGAGAGAAPGRGGRESVASTETAQQLQNSIANDAFERAKATANANAAANAARGEPVRRHAEDAADQAPPYWLTAGEEFGDDKARTG